MKRCARKGCPHTLAHLRSDAKWCSDACAQRVRRGRSAYRNPTGHSGPGGLQVSYVKALDHIEGALSAQTDRAPMFVDVEALHRLIRLALTDALPVRQRERLEARQGFTEGPYRDEEAGW